MGRIEELAEIYARHISVPWTTAGTNAQRVMMIVYDKELERTLRARMGEFEQRTLVAGKKWELIDCTNWFAKWMVKDEYRDAYFESPEDLSLKLEGEFRPFVTERIRETLRRANPNTVVALSGVASLYGFLRISELIRDVDADVRGCFLVFFPGTKDGNNYRLLDARDGWNYLAASISLQSEGARG